MTLISALYIGKVYVVFYLIVYKIVYTYFICNKHIIIDIGRSRAKSGVLNTIYLGIRTTINVSFVRAYISHIPINYIILCIYEYITKREYLLILKWYLKYQKKKKFKVRLIDFVQKI